MKRFWQAKRIAVCSCVALTVGIISAYAGSQISLRIQRQKCQAQPWGLETVCYAWAAPGAVWQGGTTGLYLGTLLGGILGVLGTVKMNAKQVIQDELTELEVFANEIELDTTQKAALRRFLILVMLRLAASEETDYAAALDTMSVEELKQLFTIAKHNQLLRQQLTQAQSQLLAEMSSTYTSQTTNN